MNLRLVKLPVVAILAMLFLSSADAADYAAGFDINAGVSRNDNVRFVQDNKIAVTKYILSPRLTFGVHTETTKADINTTLDFNRYDKSEFNSDDQNVSLQLSQESETSSLGLNAHYIRNTTITSELLTSGRIGDVADHAEQYLLSPNWTYAFTETNLIQLSGTYAAQNYENDTYIGYTNIGGELSWIHVFNDRIKFVITALTSNYQSDDTDLEVPAFNVGVFPAGYFGEQSYGTRTRSNGAQIGVDYQWSEQSLIKARFGRSESRTSYAIKDPNQICENSTYLNLVAFVGGPIGGACNLQQTGGQQSNAELEWKWNNERQEFSFSASKVIQPTSNGYAVDATHIESYWSYRLSELNRFTASLSAARNRAIDKESRVKNTSQADRNYGSATLQYQRQLSEFWFLNTSFQFSAQKYIQIEDRASSRIYSLGLSYRPQQWHRAR